ncbi:hypothetical protein Y1Q_0005213 [Alligator mississippiensis]|uniref:Uncharacterized protein n=1 Tax=Alligator mississippiensis TaxID=8496 RepID=A0A151MT14_ALLMI|nr:hypothetical protein Y1Q_0005213 [Alligator mississippiensis]
MWGCSAQAPEAPGCYRSDSNIVFGAVGFTSVRIKLPEKMVSPEPFAISELLDLSEALSLQVAKDEGELFMDYSLIRPLMSEPVKYDL